MSTTYKYDILISAQEKKNIQDITVTASQKVFGPHLKSTFITILFKVQIP